MDSTSERGQSTPSRLQYVPPRDPNAAADIDAESVVLTVSKTLLMEPSVAWKIFLPTSEARFENVRIVGSELNSEQWCKGGIEILHT